MLPALRALLLGLASVLAFSPSARAGQPAVVVSSRINGLYAGLGCRQGPEPVLSMVAGHFAAEPDALPIDAGDLLGASAVARLAVERDADALALAIAATGLRAAGMGHRDLSAHRSTLLRFLKALRAQGIRHVVSNLECDADHRPLCDQVEDASDPPLLLETPGGKVALLVFVAPELLEDLPPDRAEGLTLIPLEDAVPLEIARARAAGAVRLVLVVDPPPGGELAAAVQASSRAGDEDLVVARELPEPVVSIGTNADSAFVIATRTGEVAVWEPGSKGVRLARDAPAPLAVEEYVDGLGKWLCAEHYRPLQGGSLAGEMGRDEFATLLLDVLRQTTRAEVGVINREAIRDPGLFPLRGIATRFDVLAALPFEDVLAETRCRGSVLKAFALAPRFKEYEARGLTASDGVVKINGRPVEADQWYQVVTTGFVASLEKDGLGGGVAFERRPGSSPRDLLLAWLEQATPSGQVAQPEDPASLARWHLRISLDGALSDARIGNPDPATYNDAQLTRIEASNVALDARFYAGADHPALTFQNTLRVEYGLGRTVTEGRDSGFVETRDLVSARSGLAWRLFRSERRWYHPLPDVEGFTETEFNRPQDGTRSYHHLLLRPTLGSRFDLTARLYLRFGVGLESELFAENPLKSVGLARVELNPGELLTLGNRSIEGRFFLETAFVDPWRQLDLQVRASVQVAVPLWRFLSITAGYDTFLRALGGKRLALAGDLALGLKFAVDHSIQSF